MYKSLVLLRLNVPVNNCTDPPLPGYYQYFSGSKCVFGHGHNTAEVGIEPLTSRSGVRGSTTRPPCINYIRVNILLVCIFVHENANTYGSKFAYLGLTRCKCILKVIYNVVVFLNCCLVLYASEKSSRNHYVENRIRIFQLVHKLQRCFSSRFLFPAWITSLEKSIV